jgi:hypothetical protein
MFSSVCANGINDCSRTTIGIHSGVGRAIGDNPNSWCGRAGDTITYTFAAETELREARIVFDSNLNRGLKNMRFRSSYHTFHSREMCDIGFFIDSWFKDSPATQ